MMTKNNTKTASQTSKKGGIMKFFRGIKSEFKKITWPSKKEKKKAVIAVVICSGIYLVLVGGLDYVFQNLFEAILNLK